MADIQSVTRFVRMASITGAAAVLLASGCARPMTENKAAVGKLSSQQLDALVHNQKNLFFLDVRSPKEIRELGTLPGYVNIPIDQLDRRLSELPKNRTIVTA